MKKILQKSIYVLALLLAFSQYAEAQQLPIYNQFKFNQFVYNPALSGVGIEVPVLTMVHRNQWNSVDGAPETSLVSFNGVESDKKVGYAAYLYHDKTGVLTTTSFYGNYSFRFTIVDNFDISLGLSAGVINKGIDKSELNLTDPDEIIYDANLAGRTIFDFNAGINFSLWGLDLGLAAPQLFAQPIDYAEASPDTIVSTLVRHYVGSMRYSFNFEMQSLGRFGKGMSVVPQVIARMAPDVPVQYDAHLMLDMRNLGWIGGGYRSDMGAIANVGVNLSEDLAVGYAYEFNSSNVSQQLGSTHELSLIYKFGSSKRLVDKVQMELDQVKKEEVELMYEMEQRENRRQDSISEAIRSDIVINANDILNMEEVLASFGDEEFLEEDDLSTTASNVVAGSKGFYVVSGVFAYRINAEELNNKLAAEGYDVEYFFNKANRFYYVFLRKYKTYRMALRMRNNNINGTYFDDLWVKEVK